MKLTFVGDIFPGEEPFYKGFGIASQFACHGGKMWMQQLQELFKESDIVVGNLESPLLQHTPTPGHGFYGHSAFASFLRQSGVTHLSVANNHILEYGKGGYKQTLEALTKAGLVYLGDNFHKVTALEAGGATIAIAAMCGVYDPLPATFCPLSEETISDVMQEMNRMQADLKICYVHWGKEYIKKPSPEQRQLAQRLVDLGADFVIGHHPHVVQPYEQYKRGHIYYSLGNFCFDNPYQSADFRRGMAITIHYNSKEKIVDKIEQKGLRIGLRTLCEPMPQKEFDQYFSIIQNEYNSIKDNAAYNDIFYKEFRRRHFLERIRMKTSLFNLCFHLSLKEISMMFNNIVKYYK